MADPTPTPTPNPNIFNFNNINYRQVRSGRRSCGCGR